MMWARIILCFVPLASSLALRPALDHPGYLGKEPIPPYQHGSMAELVLPHGYPLAEHFVETPDGYVLGTYRIPYGRVPPPSTAPPRPAVLLQHGLLDSSATWVLNDPDQSLAFLLADAGYDVWLGNSRGNGYSRNHTGLSPSSKEFWRFSLDDMALVDVPATIAYVLTTRGRQRGSDRVAYVGHSQGSTIALAALGTLGPRELRSHVGPVMLLAPAFFMHDVSSLALETLAGMGFDTLISKFGTGEFIIDQRKMNELFASVCHTLPLVCTSFLTLVAGFNSANVNVTRLDRYVTYAPSGTSVRNIAHWAQAVRKSERDPAQGMAMYDFGNQCWTQFGVPRDCNRRVYNTDTAPSYTFDDGHDLPPLAVVWGLNDKLADPLDIARLVGRLPASAVKLATGILGYEHLDFVWGSNAKDLVYPLVLDFLQGWHAM